MNLRNSVKVNIPEYSRKSPEILILQPACSTIAVYLHCKPVVLLSEIGCDVEFGWCKAVLAVAYELAVQPYIESCFYALKAYVCFLAEKFLICVEVFHVAAYRISLFRYLRRKKLFLAFPRILCVYVLRAVIALKLDVRRNRDLIKISCVKIFPVKFSRSLLRSLAETEFPSAVQ